MLQLITGLQATAAAGILHRDIKPSNCFVDAYGYREDRRLRDFPIAAPDRGYGALHGRPSARHTGLA